MDGSATFFELRYAVTADKSLLSIHRIPEIIQNRIVLGNRFCIGRESSLRPKKFLTGRFEDERLVRQRIGDTTPGFPRKKLN